MESASTDPLLLTIKQAALLLGLSTRALYRWSAEGRLPGLRRIGRSLFVSRSELMAWLKVQGAQTTQNQ